MAAELSERFPELARELGPDRLQVLRHACTALTVPAGRPIIRDRMAVDSLYLILEGTVTVSVEEGGRSIEIGRLGPGQWLGEVSVLSGEMLASSTVSAETPVSLLRLKHLAFEGLLAKQNLIGSAIVKQLVLMLADRLRAASKIAAQPVTVKDATAQPSPATTGRSQSWLQTFFGKTGT